MLVVDALAHLHSDRQIASCLHGRVNNRLEEISLPRQRSAATLASDFGNRATEVEVNMVGFVLVNQQFDCFRNSDRINTVKLHTSDVFALVMTDDSK